MPPQRAIQEEQEDARALKRSARARKFAVNAWKNTCCKMPDYEPARLRYPHTAKHSQLVSIVKLNCTPEILLPHREGHLFLMKDLVDWIHKQELPIPVKLIGVFVHHFDQVFTQGRLMERIQLAVTAPGELRKQGLRGLCSMYTVRNERGETLQCALIRIDPEREEGETVLRWHTRVLSTLIHELDHAYVNIFMDHSFNDLRKYLSIVGIMGHGSMFHDIYHHIAMVLRQAVILDVNEYDAFGRHVASDADILQRMGMIANSLVDPEWTATDDVKASWLRSCVEVHPEKASNFRMYLDQGYSPLETAFKISRFTITINRPSLP